MDKCIVKSLGFVDIVGFPDYVINCCGDVWSCRLRGSRFSGVSNTYKMVKPRSNGSGHLFVSLCVCGVVHKRYIHRLVLETFVSMCPNGMECRHLDGNPKNNNVENLRWGTPKENAADRIRHGTSVSGSKNGLSKLTDDQVREIRKKYAGKSLSKTSGSEYGVTHSTIRRVLRREVYRSVVGV